MYISGKWRTVKSGKAISIENPYTGSVISEVPRATVADVEEAVGAAYEHQGKIAELTAHERAFAASSCFRRSWRADFGRWKCEKRTSI